MWIPVVKHWRLNERHYGMLQGFNKRETGLTFGKLQTQLWRKSYEHSPPVVSYHDEVRHPRFDRRYASLSYDVIPLSESLK